MKAPPTAGTGEGKEPMTQRKEAPMDSLQVFKPNSGALSAESYQTFELAKENDTILGSTDIAQIRSYAAFARARAQAVHKSIAAMNRLDDVTATKAEMTETAQTFAKVGIYADQRIGEILRELPTSNRWSDSPTGKTETIKESGMSTKTAYDLQAMAANPDVVQAVLDKAEAEGRIPSRKQVLDAIKERDTASARVTSLQSDLADALKEIDALERQNDQLYEKANAKPEAQVVTRVVESDSAKKRISELEHLEQLHSSDNQKLRRKLEEARRELDKAKVLIGEKQRNDSAEWDIAALTTATNNYLRQYGGKAWAFDQFYRVNETTQAEFVKAINNLAAFAQNLAQMIREQTNE